MRRGCWCQCTRRRSSNNAATSVLGGAIKFRIRGIGGDSLVDLVLERVGLGLHDGGDAGESDLDVSR